MQIWIIDNINTFTVEDIALKKLKFNPIQMRIMQVLWERGHATAVEITESITENKRVPHSTVQSHLRFLEEKGAIAHDVDQRTFVYRALIEDNNMKKHTLREVIDQVFAGSAESLVLSLVNNKYVTRKELEQVLDLLNDTNEDDTS